MSRPLLIGFVVAFVALHLFSKQRGATLSPGTSVASALESVRDPGAAEIVRTVKDHKVTVVAFFETWCGPCKQELPQLAKLYDERRDDGLAVVGVYGPSSQDIAAFRDRYRVSFPTIPDSQGALAGVWGVDVVPTSVVLDANLQMIHAVRGYRSSFVQDLAALLNKEPLL